MTTFSIILLAIASAGIGGGVVLLAFQRKQKNQNEITARLQNNIDSCVKEKDWYKRQYDDLQKDIKLSKGQMMELTEHNGYFKAENKNLKEKLLVQKDEMLKMHDDLTLRFNNLANRIFDEKGDKFTRQNKQNLDSILTPLKEKITDFEKRVIESQKESIDRHAALRQQIENLRSLNERITKEATNLTLALKGNTKVQGNWGEMVLESILEKSGLKRDREYFVQNTALIDGRRLVPDVVIALPENKHIVIDAKVSLIAYEQYVNATDESERNNFLKTHILSVQRHIKNLSDKDYSALYKLSSIDFVLLFMPIEPAFALAIQHTENLFTEALERNIVLVSPSTLIATLRTIASIWRQEYQNRNAQEIAQLGGELYNKFVGFTNDMMKIGERIQQSQQSFNDAMGKLSSGKGNLIRRAEKLKELGAKTNQSINSKLLDE